MELYNLRTFYNEIYVERWIIKTIKYKYKTIFLMFVLASALDQKWYNDLINKINNDLFMNYIYKSYPTLALSIIYNKLII